MGKKNNALNFQVTAVVILIVVGFLTITLFDRSNTLITGNSNSELDYGISPPDNDYTVYGTEDTLFVAPSKTPTITAVKAPVSSSVSIFDYSLQAVEPPILGQPTLQIGNDGKVKINDIKVQPGEKYSLNFVVNYRAKELSKYYANIIPDSRNEELWAEAHMDNVKVTGKGLQGDGTMNFSLKGVAPMEAGSHPRAVTMGLMDYYNWATEGSLVHYSFPFLLHVE